MKEKNVSPNRFLCNALLFMILHSVVALGQETPAVSPPRVRLPVFAFEAHPSNPILIPQGTTWEAHSVAAPAAIVKQDTLFLLYEAAEQAHAGIWSSTARIGLAFSTNGVSFVRVPGAVLVPTLDFETPGGCRDPRVIFSNGTYYMTYSAFDTKTTRLALASSPNLRHWQKHGLVLPDTGATHAGGILSQKINGRFLMYYGKQDIRIAYSNDLLHWFPQAEPVLRPRVGKFDNAALAPGPPPLLIDSTIVVLYNASDSDGHRACGLVRFSMDNPTTVLARLESPLFALPQSGIRSESTLMVSSLVWFRGQYELFYSELPAAIGMAKGRLLYAENK